MPFKDINLNKLNESNTTHNTLYNKIAQINKLTGSTIKDNTARLPTVELISGKKVTMNENPISIIQAKLDLAEKTKPITDQLQKLNDQQQIDLQYQDLLANQQMAILENQSRPRRLPSLPDSEPREVDISELEGVALDERTMDLLASRNSMYRNINEVFTDYESNPTELTDLASKVIRDLNGMKGDKGSLTRNFNAGYITREEYMQQKNSLDKEYDAVKKYHNTLKVFKQVLVKKGDGIIQIGDYWVDKRKLNRDNILSVRYNKNKNMVGQFGAKKVSNNVKQVINQEKMPEDVELSKTEKQFLDKLYLTSGAKITPSKAQLIRGGEAFTSLKEMSDKLKIIMGQIKAGNSSRSIRNEAMDIVHYLFKNKKIKKASYKEIVTFLTTN